MRYFTLIFVLLAAHLAAHAAPRKTAKKVPARLKTSPTPLQAVPLSPEKLRGQVAYILGGDVWAIDPKTRKKQLLYKHLFSPPQFSTDYLGTSNIAWSPDRQLVAYNYRNPEKGGGAELFIMRWDGSQKRQITDTKYRELAANPHWSPDGKQLTYTLHSEERMGGPGFDHENLHLFDLNSKKDVILLPWQWPVLGWSRDGKRILFRRVEGTMDNGVDPKWVLKTIKSDGSDEQPFAENWGDYIVKGQSRDGKWRAVYVAGDGINPPRWAKHLSGTTGPQGRIWTMDNGFSPEWFCLSDDGTNSVLEGSLATWHLDAQGTTKRERISGIWSLESSSLRHFYNEIPYYPPRLLVRNAHLINWF